MKVIHDMKLYGTVEAMKRRVEGGGEVEGEVGREDGGGGEGRLTCPRGCPTVRCRQGCLQH